MKSTSGVDVVVAVVAAGGIVVVTVANEKGVVSEVEFGVADVAVGGVEWAVVVVVVAGCCREWSACLSPH